MPKSNETSSSEADGQQENRFVFDFLYHDVRRLGTFLAQLGSPGVLQTVEQTAGVDTTEESVQDMSGKIDFKIAGAGLSSTDKAGVAVKDGTRQTYDPLWTNAVSFMTLLDQRGLLSRDIKSARIGQFVLSKGKLSIMDLAIMQRAMRLATVKRLIKAGPVGQKKKSAEQSQQLDMVLELMEVFPHPVQATLEGEEFSIWCTLVADSLVTPPGDLLLKHGTLISGRWNMLGIVDAEPADMLAQEEAVASVVMAGTASPESIVTFAIQGLAPLARTYLGRPSNAYGITPILIFRVVN